MALARIVQRYRENGHQFVHLVFILGTEEKYARLTQGSALYAESGQRLEIRNAASLEVKNVNLKYPLAIAEVIDNGDASGKVTDKEIEAANWNLDRVESITKFKAKDTLKIADWTERVEPIKFKVPHVRKITDPSERLKESRILLELAGNARESMGLIGWNFSPLREKKAYAKNLAVDAKDTVVDTGKAVIAEIKENTPALQAAAKKAAQAVQDAAKEGLAGTWAAFPDGVKYGIYGVGALGGLAVLKWALD